MDKEKFPFTVGDTQYIIWIWRGDYLNLGAGAEIGIYARPSSMSQDPEKLDHYFAFYNNAVPMNLSLYNITGDETYENIYSWNPTEDQWWCCGFNPEYIGNVDVDKQVMVGKIDLSQSRDVFDQLFKTSDKSAVDYNEAVEKYMYFDRDNYLVWILWGESI